MSADKDMGKHVFSKSKHFRWELQMSYKMICVGMDVKDCLILTPLPWGYLLLDQAAQRPIQPGLEHFQQQDIHNVSG